MKELLTSETCTTCGKARGHKPNFCSNPWHDSIPSNEHTGEEYLGKDRDELRAIIIERDIEIESLQQFKEWAEPQCQDYAANRMEIERLENIVGHAVALLETMHVNDALKVLRLGHETPDQRIAEAARLLRAIVWTPGPNWAAARRAWFEANALKANSHYCIDHNEAHDPRTCGALGPEKSEPEQQT
jgi:hypothetical protein